MAEITSEIVEAQAADLGEGGHRYTPRRLYYAVCAAVEVPRVAMASGVTGSGVILLMLAVILYHWPPLAYALGVLGLLLLLYGARLRVVEAHRLTAVRARAIGYDEFVRRFVEPHSGEPQHFEGMIDVASWGPTEHDVRHPLLVCDTSENAALVAALVEEESIPVTVTDAPRVDLTAVRFIAMHDASVRGCAFPLDLKDRVGRAVVDGGIRPRDVIGHDLQEIEGAPGLRPPRDLGPVLSPDEIGWLVGGRRLELAAFPRERLAALVRAAVEMPAGADQDGVTEAASAAATGTDRSAR